jgi:leucyl/phenylalanyl-tRNA--protein transferase
MIPWLRPSDPFPPVASALKDPNGLLAAGGDLSAARLITAYRKGIFPWFSDGQPVLWWSPDPRMVLAPSELKISRSLRKRLKRRDYRVSSDTAFRQVILACSEPRDYAFGTWITPEVARAYTRLHSLGFAHSIETWIDERLAGGLYGVAIGSMFFGESMFYRAPDGSKIAFVHLVRQLARWGFGLIDCQMKTAHLASFGAREIPRREFTRRLEELVNYPREPCPWQLENELLE